MSETKNCNQCDQTLSLECFTGKYSICNHCRNIKRRLKYEIKKKKQ